MAAKSTEAVRKMRVALKAIQALWDTGEWSFSAGVADPLTPCKLCAWSPEGHAVGCPVTTASDAVWRALNPTIEFPAVTQ